VVITGDINYKNSAEEQNSVLSRWAYHKVSSQVDEQFIDGRKSFIFSWDKELRPIHEEAMLHFLDPEKKGEKFVPKLFPVEPKGHQVDPKKAIKSPESFEMGAETKIRSPDTQTQTLYDGQTP